MFLWLLIIILYKHASLNDHLDLWPALQHGESPFYVLVSFLLLLSIHYMKYLQSPRLHISVINLYMYVIVQPIVQNVGKKEEHDFTWRKAVDLEVKMKIINDYETDKKKKEVKAIEYDLELVHLTVSMILRVSFRSLLYSK